MHELWAYCVLLASYLTVRSISKLRSALEGLTHAFVVRFCLISSLALAGVEGLIVALYPCSSRRPLHIPTQHLKLRMASMRTLKPPLGLRIGEFKIATAAVTECQLCLMGE